MPREAAGPAMGRGKQASGPRAHSGFCLISDGLVIRILAGREIGSEVADGGSRSHQQVSNILADFRRTTSGTHDAPLSYASEAK